MIERALQPGDHLPSERDLTAAFAVSRQVVREAIRSLEDEGLVAVEHGKDTLVQRCPPVSDMVDIPEHGPDTDQFAMDARAVFEAGLAECVVERATEADLQRLEATVAEMQRRVALGHPGNEDDLAFHEQLHYCTHNPILIQVGRVVVLTHMRRRLMQVPIGPLLDAPEEVYPGAHAAIVAMIRARDAGQLRHLLQAHPDPAQPPGQPSPEL
jgi:GntR family transcriptional repressor for pyruvate dehydrogenase complex